MKKLHLFLLTLIMSITLVACQSNDGVSFSDEKLEDSIRTELSIDEENIQKSDLEKVKKLELSNQGIKSLEGIEKLAALENLSLENNEITDLTPVLDLENLKKLNVIGNPLTEDEEQMSLVNQLIDQGVTVKYEEVIGRADGPGGYLWKVENGNTTVYLQGTIHVGTKDFYPLHESIEKAYHEADVVVPEIDLNEIDMFEIQSIYSELGEYNDGTTIRDHLSDETYDELSRVLTDLGLPIQAVEHYKPWMLTSLIQSLMAEQLGYLYGVDEYFLNKAKLDGKEVIPLETAELQFNVLSGVSHDYQIEMLKESLVDIEEYDQQLQEMFALYKAGNEDELLEYLMVDAEEDENAEFADEAQAYLEALNDERNYGMADKIQGFLEEDDGRTYFVIVGTLHLILEPHVGSILEERGFEVEKVH
ncbi:TraB/GumN family protein [Bacillaceae bacterium W0354]